MSTKTTIRIRNEVNNETKWCKVIHDSYPYDNGSINMIQHYRGVVRQYLTTDGIIEFNCPQRFVDIEENNLWDYLGKNSYLVEINLNKTNPNFKIFIGSHRYKIGDGYTYDCIESINENWEEIQKNRENKLVSDDEGVRRFEEIIYHPTDYYFTKEFDSNWLIETHTYDTKNSSWVYERDIEKLIKWDNENEIRVGDCTDLIDGYVRNNDGYLILDELETIKN